MKKFAFVLCISVLPFASGCGTDEDCKSSCGSDDGGTDNGGDSGDSGDNGQTVVNVAPFRSPSAGVLEFSTAYIAGTSCAQVRGTLPGLTWSSGADLGSEVSGYRGVSLSLAAGTYEMSYVGWANCSNRTPDVWADYGKKEKLTAMSAADRAFIQCNWWNGLSLTGVSNPSCQLRISVSASGQISGAGNMANYNGQ